MKYIKTISIYFLSLIFVFGLIIPVLAQTTDSAGNEISKDSIFVKLQVPLPFVATNCKIKNLEGDMVPAVCSLSDYIQGMYRLLIGTGALFAVIMIIIAGYQWIFAGGSADKTGAAKKRIFGAVVGLILALLSFIILNTITPRLVALRVPDVEPVKGIEFTEGETCQNSKYLIKEEQKMSPDKLGANGKIYVLGEGAIKETTRDLAYCGYTYYALDGPIKNNSDYARANQSFYTCRGDYCENNEVCISGKCINAYLYGDISMDAGFDRGVESIYVFSLCGDGSQVDYKDVNELLFYKFPIPNSSEDEVEFGDYIDRVITGAGRIFNSACNLVGGDSRFVLKVVIDDGFGIDDEYALGKNCSAGAIGKSEKMSWSDFYPLILTGQIPEVEYFTEEDFNQGIRCDLVINENNFPDLD